MGAQVDTDPRSQNFLKIQIGGEKLDITGGNAIYIRLLARLYSGESISASGKVTELGEGYKPQTRAGLISDFFRNKLSPVAGFLFDAAYGSDPAGRPFSLTKEMQDKLMPIVIGNFINYAMNDPTNAAAVIPSLASFFGVGLESPMPPVTRNGTDVWGEPMPVFGTPRSWTADPVNQEAEKVHLSLNMPMDKIRGVKLTDGQMDEYVHLSGNLAHQRLGDVVKMDNWDQVPAGEKRKVMQSVIRRARESAAASIMLEARGGQNDILAQATAAKMAALQGAPQQP